MVSRKISARIIKLFGAGNSRNKRIVGEIIMEFQMGSILEKASLEQFLKKLSKNLVVEFPESS